MWDEDPDFFDVLEEHDLEYESGEYSCDLEHEPFAEEVTDEDLFDEHDEYTDYDH